MSVWTVGYDAAVSRWRGQAMHLTDRGMSILARLLDEPGIQQGEIVLIGHSLGGLVIEQLISIADSMAAATPEAAHFIKRIRRVAFIATPHQGSGHASWVDKLQLLFRPSTATVSLVRNDPNLRELNLWYRDWYRPRSISHLILTENRPTRFLGGSTLVGWARRDRNAGSVRTEIQLIRRGYRWLQP